MGEFYIRNSLGLRISRWEDWTRPKRKYQWKPGRSAMELAKAWFRKGDLSCPIEVAALLRSNASTAKCTLLGGQPEYVTPLPERGEGRNHDLWLRAECCGRPLTIGVEAKTDESFGEYLGEAIDDARKRNPRTRLPARAAALLRLLFGRSCDPMEPPWSLLRYQVITALAGIAIQAALDGSSLGVLVVHEFRCSVLNPDRVRQNAKDLDTVLALLGHAEPLVPGKLVGPFHLLPGDCLSAKVDLLVGKAVYDLSEITTNLSKFD